MRVAAATAGGARARKALAHHAASASGAAQASGRSRGSSPARVCKAATVAPTAQQAAVAACAAASAEPRSAVPAAIPCSTASATAPAAVDAPARPRRTAVGGALGDSASAAARASRRARRAAPAATMRAPRAVRAVKAATSPQRRGGVSPHEGRGMATEWRAVWPTVGTLAADSARPCTRATPGTGLILTDGAGAQLEPRWPRPCERAPTAVA